MSDIFGPLSQQVPTTWPHKCSVCGRFVKLSTLRGGVGGYPDYDYWATADCTKCGRRTNANPI